MLHVARCKKQTLYVVEHSTAAMQVYTRIQVHKHTHTLIQIFMGKYCARTPLPLLACRHLCLRSQVGCTLRQLRRGSVVAVTAVGNANALRGVLKFLHLKQKKIPK